MAPLIHLCLGLIVAVMVVATHSTPLVPKTAEPNIDNKVAPRDRILAIGAPLLMSKYVEYVPKGDHEGQERVVSARFFGGPRTMSSHQARAPWWSSPKTWYQTLFRCPKGEKRDATGVCRQPWDDEEDR